MSLIAGASTSPSPATSEARLPQPTQQSPVRQIIGRIDVVLAVAVLIGGVLRFWRLGAQSLWYDEWATVRDTSGGLPDVIRHVANGEGTPPPYFVLMWGWVRVFGDGEVALRAVSALAGIAMVPVAYAIARELRQPRAVARTAALLVAVNPMLVWYSQEARAYSLLALAGALSWLAFARVRRRGGTADFVAWALLGACAVAIHYFAAFLVGAEAVALLASRRSQWRRLLLACAPSAAVLAALAPIAVRQHSHAENHLWISQFRLADRLGDAGRSALVGPNPPVERLWVVGASIVVLAALLLAGWAGRDDRRVVAVTAGAVTVSVVLPVIAAIVGFDAVVGRYLIVSLVPLVVAVSVGLVASRAGWVGPTAVAILCGVSLTAVVADARDPDLQRPDWRAVAGVFERGGQDVVLVVNVDGVMASPLFHYVDHARPLGDDEVARVDEVDVLVAKPTDKPCNFFVGMACAMVFLGAPPPDPLASQLTFERRVDLDQFAVDRYRARQPLSVTKADLVGPADRPHALVLVADH